MATIKTSDSDVQLFGPSDIYRYDVDNRPLRNLISNDEALNAELVADTAEIVQARTGLFETYPSLDARLDDLELGAGYPQKVVTFNEFLARAKGWQARYASGTLHPITDTVKMLDVWGSKAVGNIAVPVTGAYGYPGFGQLFLRDESAANGVNRVELGNGLKPRFTSGTGAYDFLTYRPVYFSVGGMVVALFNEAGGVAGTGPASEITWNLPAAPSASGRVDLLWIEVWLQNVTRSSPSFYPYGAVGSLASPLSTADDPSLQGNVGFYGGNNGDYWQLCHRLRVSTVANPDLNPFGLSDQANVLAQGANSSVPGSPTSHNVFVCAAKSQGDPGLWVAGLGDSGSKSELGTIDGYVYAIPVALVFRRNTGQWTHSNQNGSRTSGGAGTWSTGDSARPDGYYHDKIEKSDIVHITPSCVSERTNLKRLLDESFDRLLRGQLRTKHGFLDYTQYYIEDTIGSTNEAVGGAELVSANSISGSAEAKTDQFFEPDGTTKCLPDDFRRLFSPQPETQPVGFTITITGAVGSPANLVTLASSVVTIAAVGQSVGSSGAIINDAPVLWWSGSKKPVALTGSWSGLGTGTITATLNTGDTNYNGSGTVVGLVKIVFPGTRVGMKKANTATVGQTYTDPTPSAAPAAVYTTLGTDKLLGPMGVALDATYFYVVDRISHKAYKVNRSTLAVSATFGVYGTSAADNTHLNNPAAVAVDGSGNVYIADSGNHRVIKLNSSMVYQGQFGVTGTSGADNSHLNTPQGVTVDGSGNIYISDTLNYRIMKVSAAYSYIGVFGVVGVSVPDTAHCVFPRHAYFGDDSKLYVADQVRVIILNPSTMTTIAFLENGYGTPIVRANSVTAVSPANSIEGIREDSSGNKYVCHGSGAADMNGHVATILTKYDSTWNFVARYGARWDTVNRYGGTNAGMTNGLIQVTDFFIDEANDAIHIFEWNIAADSTNGLRQNRVISIKMSDLSLYQVRATPDLHSGAMTVYGPVNGLRTIGAGSRIPTNPATYGLDYPELLVTDVEYDATHTYLYVVYSTGSTLTDFSTSGWQRIEKWSVSGTDPNAWTFVTYFGEIDYAIISGRYQYRAWYGASMDNSRLLQPAPWGNGASMSDDGSAVFIADNETVIKLNTTSTGMTYVGRFGTSGVAGNDSSHLSFLPTSANHSWGILIAMVGSEADSNGRVYVFDTGNNRIVILRKDLTYVTVYTNPRLAYLTLSGGRSYANTNGAGKLWNLTNGGSFFGLWELNVAGANRDAPVYVDTNASSNATVYVPVTLNTLPAGMNFDIFGLTKVSGVLFWSDFGTSQLVSVETPDYAFFGEAGVPGTSGGDKATWRRPTGLAADTRYLYVCDYVNNRILMVDQHVAYVEPNVGRVEFLMAPVQGSKWYGYTKFSPLQGVYQRGKQGNTFDNGNAATKYPRLSGRHLLMSPDKMLVTTMGKASVEGLSDPGVMGYSNCVQRLPLPLYSGTVAIGVNDERLVRPTEFLLVGNIMNPRAHYFLPLLNMLADYSNGYDHEAESFWQKETLLSYGDLTYSAQAGVKGGYQTEEYIGGAQGLATPVNGTGPLVVTFSCGTVPAYRVLAIPFLVVVEGEILLAVKVQVQPSGVAENELGASDSSAIIELFRCIGHPMLPNHSEADSSYDLTTA